MEQKLPIYTNVAEIKRERKEKYLSALLKNYPNLEKLTEDEYFDIKWKLEEDKDTSVLQKLMEKSLYYIIEAVADTYAKYDIEDMLPMEDGLAITIQTINEKLNKFETLPTYVIEYTHSAIYYYTYLILAREYNKEYSRTNVLDIMEPSKLTYEIDKREFDVLDKSKFNRENFLKKLNIASTYLSEKEKKFIELRFGLVTGEEMSCQDIAKMYNASRSGISLAIRRAITKLRWHRTTRELKDCLDTDIEV